MEIIGPKEEVLMWVHLSLLDGLQYLELTLKCHRIHTDRATYVAVKQLFGMQKMKC